MKRICSFILVLILTLLLLGCNSNDINDGKSKGPDGEAGIIGYVVNKDNGRILVVSSDAQDFSSTGGIDEYYDAIWFSKAPEDIEIGEKVKVWFDIVAESYPGQSEALHIEVIPAEKPEGSDLSDAEALHEALTNNDIDNEQVLVVKSVEFDSKADSWNITLKEVFTDKEHELKIEDK